VRGSLPLVHLGLDSTRNILAKCRCEIEHTQKANRVQRKDKNTPTLGRVVRQKDTIDSSFVTSFGFQNRVTDKGTKGKQAEAELDSHGCVHISTINTKYKQETRSKGWR